MNGRPGIGGITCAVLRQGPSVAVISCNPNFDDVLR
jgi:hypothetical protein